jgi:hypothetical protein
MVDLQQGLLSGTTNTVERLTGIAPMSVRGFIEANRDLYTPRRRASVSN